MRPWSPAQGKRLDALRRSASVTQEQLIADTGIPKATLQRILGGTAVPTDERLQAILQRVGRTEADLADSDEASFVEVPMYDIDVAAGPGRFLTSEAAIGTWPFPRQWVERQFGRNADLALLRVSGDSQEPVLRDGDAVMIDLDVRRREGMAVVRLDEALLIKRVQIEGRIVRLVSHNPAYSDVLVELADDDRFEVIGRAVWAGKLL